MGNNMPLKFPKLSGLPAGAKSAIEKDPVIPEELAGIRTELVRVTPEMAEEWLRTSPGNRTEAREYVSMIARAVDTNAFRVTHQGVAFDDQGRFRDGHHRLRGIIEAKKPAYLLVTFGIPSDNFEAVDMNRVRSAADILGGMGVGEGIESPGRRTAMVRALVRLMSGLPKTHVKLSIHEIKTALGNFSTEIDWAMSLKRVGPVSMYAALAFAWPVDKDKINEFATEVIENHSSRPKAPGPALAMWLAANSRRAGGAYSDDVMCKTLWCAKQHCLGRSITNGVQGGDSGYNHFAKARGL